MSKELKITKGVARYSEYGKEVTTSKEGILEGGNRICALSEFGKTEDEVKANGNLIAESFTVANECGLTPRQLMEQRDEALETLKMAQNVLRMASLIDKSNTCEKAEVEVTATINKLSK